MKKTLYFDTRRKREHHGLFYSLRFEDYMENYAGTDFVGSHSANGGKDSIRIYHIVSKGVTVHHQESEEGQVSVDLFGKRKNIGNVEKIILKAARKFELTRTKKQTSS